MTIKFLSLQRFTLEQKRHLHNFWTKYDKSCHCAALPTNKKDNKNQTPTSLQFHDSRPLPHPTYLLFMCSKKEIEI